MQKLLDAAVRFWQTHHGLKVALGLLGLAVYHACTGHQAAALTDVLGALGLHFTVSGQKDAPAPAPAFTADAYKEMREGSD